MNLPTRTAADARYGAGMPAAPASGPVELGPATRLPARREDVELHTADRLTLVGELALPVDRDPVATLVCLHPLSTHGGFMDSHLIRKASYRLPALLGAAVLRFNLRGVSSPRGTSEGSFGDGVAEQQDVDAALALVRQRGLPEVHVLGWSFGTDLALMYARDPLVRSLVLVSPPLRYTREEHLAAWAADGRPVLALVPELDDFLRPAEAVERFRSLRQVEIVGEAGAKHLWPGEKNVRTVLDHVAERLVPGSSPLPTQWSGDYERVTDPIG